MAKNYLWGGLSWDTTDATLSQFFSQAGTVISAVVIVDNLPANPEDLDLWKCPMKMQIKQSKP